MYLRRKEVRTVVYFTSLAFFFIMLFCSPARRGYIIPAIPDGFEVIEHNQLPTPYYFFLFGGPL